MEKAKILEMLKISVLTRCTRPRNLSLVKSSIDIARSNAPNVSLNWVVIFDTSVISEIPSDILSSLEKKCVLRFQNSISGDFGHSLLNTIIDELDYSDWFYVLDDDNEMHPELLKEVFNSLEKDPRTEGFIFSQHVGGKDFSKLETREALPENVRVQHIDMAQFLLKKSLLGEKRFMQNCYTADGFFIEELYRQFPGQFTFIRKVLCNYNSIEPEKTEWWLPRIMTLDSSPSLKTKKWSVHESGDLKVIPSSDQEAKSVIASEDPDCIITEGASYEKYSSLKSLSYDFRQRWIHVENTSTAGDNAYACANNYILNPDYSDLVSIFTPVYNTREKLHRTYRSILSQTHANWEWVIVNDSSDALTDKILREISCQDPRVKVFDIRPRTRGKIGEAKYRACCFTKGSFLIELDHDDYLLPHALEKMLEAFRTYPDSGFVYSDCAEIDENWNSLTYGENFSFGYGSYREEIHLGVVFKVASTANINPMTMRHIVGVPNHFRAWRRETYFSIGGHNRRLTIADDYELVIRTFLNTRITKIPLCCYLQFHHNGNSQNSSRSDIQRRVRSICLFYNDAIKKRFEELGKEDWAYLPSGLPWNLPSRFGEEENFVNYIL